MFYNNILSESSPAYPGTARGAALVISLVLLLLLTLLAVTGMARSTLELMMSGAEQNRRDAKEAAAAAIEAALSHAREFVPTSAGRMTSGPLSVARDSVATYRWNVRFVGTQHSLPGSSVDRFEALHYEIEGTGHSTRGAEDSQVQGIFIVAPSSASISMSRRSGGLEAY